MNLFEIILRVMLGKFRQFFDLFKEPVQILQVSKIDHNNTVIQDQKTLGLYQKTIKLV